jgi:hypothetical protein
MKTFVLIRAVDGRHHPALKSAIGARCRKFSVNQIAPSLIVVAPSYSPPAIVAPAVVASDNISRAIALTLSRAIAGADTNITCDSFTHNGRSRHRKTATPCATVATDNAFLNPSIHPSIHPSKIEVISGSLVRPPKLEIHR